MSRSIKTLAKHLLGLALIATAAQAGASDISFAQDPAGAKWLKNLAEPEDVLIPAIPNAAGVARHTLSNLVVDRPLRILNSRGLAGRESTSPAQLIILESSNLTLTSRIEIVGETADLLILNTGPSDTVCSNCSFVNAGRVTLATATADYQANNQPDKLTPTAALLRIGNLTTAKVASLELVSKNLVIEGAINTQARGYIASDGAYVTSPSGNLVIGSGGVNAFVGLQIKYASLANTQEIPGASFQFNNPASIQSQAVRINSSAPVNLGGVINTRSDAASASVYRGKFTSNEEAIRVVALSPDKALQVTGSLLSDYLVDLRGVGGINLSGIVDSAGLMAVASSTAPVVIASSANINLPGNTARWPVVASGGGTTLTDLRNNATCAQNTAQPGNVDLCLSGYFTGSTIENNGQVRGRALVFSAVNELQNRYGGKIFGDFIHLSSDTKFVRNGSAYPFRTAAEPILTFSPINPSAPPLGTVSINGVPFLSALDGASKTALSAWVIGKHIQVVAAGNVENINPYFVYTKESGKWFDTIEFSPEKIAQVLMVADNTLKIGSKSYILNASANMGVNNTAGTLLLDAPVIANQRYSTHAVIDSYQQSSSDATLSGEGVSLMVYSPPGVIYSFAPGVFNLGATGSFVNNTSYFEMLSDATFTNVDSGSIVNIGLNLSRNVTSVTIPAYTTCLTDVEKKYRGVGVRLENAEETGRAKAKAEADCATKHAPLLSLVGTDVNKQHETLFSIRGRFGADLADFKVSNHNYNNVIKNQAIASYIEDFNRSATMFSGSTPYFSATYDGKSLSGTLKYDFIEQAGLAPDGKSVQIRRISQGITQMPFNDDQCISHPGCTNSKSDINTTYQPGAALNAGQKTVEFTEFLAAKYAQFKAALIAAIEKFVAKLGL
jgi:hypothetical protein